MKIILLTITTVALGSTLLWGQTSNLPPGVVPMPAVRALPPPPLQTDDTRESFIQTNVAGLGLNPSRQVDQRIIPVEGGAQAEFGLQKTFFPVDVRGIDPVIIAAPDGRHLSFRATFLALHNTSSGQSLLLAEVTNRIGAILSNNQVIYTNAFDRLNADIRYRYTKYSLEQDIILHERPTLPEEFAPENTRLEIWTEWFDSEPVSLETQAIDLRGSDTTGLLTPSLAEDNGVDFGTMKIVAGHAFSSTAQDERTPVGKRWVRIEGRDWLIETVDYLAVRSRLELLPRSRRSASYSHPSSERETLIRSLARRNTPTPRNEAKMRLAQATRSSLPEFVMDFIIVSSVPVPSGAISWWPAAVSTNAFDAITNNHGRLINSATNGVGKVGQGFVFNSDNSDYIAATNAASLNPTNGLTIESWIYFTDSNNMPIVSKDSFSGRQYLFSKYLNNKLRAHVGITNGNFYYTDSMTVLQTSTWYHVAMTYSAANSTLGIYINGQPDTNVMVSGSMLTTTNQVHIGGTPEWLEYYWKGGIDEPSIYNRALGASEIQAIYDAGAAGKHNPNCILAPTNIVAWWPGDGNGYDLARTNFATLSNATYEPGVVGQAFFFNGTNAGVTAANDNALNLATTNDTVSIETWIKPLTNTTTYGVMSIAGKRYTPNSSSATGYELFLVNGVPGFQIANTAGTPNNFIATNDLRGSGYHHVVVSLNRSLTNGLRIYVDGVLAANPFNPTTLSGSLSNSAPFRIGVHPQSGFNGWYKGVIDEVTVYRRALDGLEVTALYAAGSAGKCKVDSDSDGLTDLQEDFLGTDPEDADSDNDGLTDGDEVFVHHTQPGYPDSDYDGLSDGQEIAGGTNPNVANAPVILTQPQDQIVGMGSNATFSVTMTGNVIANYRYQWRSNTVAIPGATNFSFTLTNVLPSYAANYSVIVTNIAGSVTSSVAVLTVICLTPPSGLVGWWQGENHPLDSVSTNHGTVLSGVTYTNGRAGQAFRFSGSNARMDIADAPALRPANFTMEAWIYPTSLSSGWRTIMLKARNANGLSFGLYARSGTDNWPSAFINVGGSDIAAAGTAAVPLNTWTHLAATYNGSALRLYTNGVLARSQNVTGSVSYTANALSLGGNTSWGEYFAGLIDEATLYNRALTANEIANVYLAGSRGKCWPATILQPPKPRRALVGGNATFSVAAAGSPVLSYQWQFAGADIPNATNSTLVLTNLEVVNSGLYSVIVTNFLGAATASATLTVLPCFPALDVALVIDNSSSMQNGPLANAKLGASNFVTQLEFPADQAAIVSFASNSVLHQPLTTNGPNLISAIYGIPQLSGSRIDLGISAAQAELESIRQNTNALPVMVLLSDGNPSGTTIDEVLNVATQAKNAGTYLVTVGFGNINTNNLKAIASSTNAFYYVTNSSQLTNVYAAIANSLCRGASNAFGITLLTPTNGQNFAWSPTNILLSATVYGATSPVVTVEFFAGTDRIGAATHLTAGNLYSLNWHPVIGGNYQLTARATDTNGAMATSSVVNITVNRQPTVSITSPTNGTKIFTPGTDLTITAAAADSDGSVANVQFFTNSVSLGNDTSSPYSISWNNVQPGTYTLFARATDNLGASSNSSAIVVTVYPANAAPQVDAGPDQTVRLPNSTLLTGSVFDDGLPLGNTLTFHWINVGQPIGATNHFASSNQPITEFVFDKVGSYTNRLLVSDGELTGSNDVVVTVLNTNLPPVVHPGEYGIISDRLATQLAGVVTDDGQPAGGMLTTSWSTANGSPGSVVFANASNVNTLVTFEREGAYLLTLTANDGELTTSTNVMLYVISNTLPYQATGYLYRIVDEDQISDFYETNFSVDASWTNGQAAFGTWTGCPLNTNAVRTEWPNTTTPTNVSDLLIRRSFEIPEGTTNLSMGVAVDNDSWVYINGILITDTNAHWHRWGGYGYLEEYSDANTLVGRFVSDGCPDYDDLKLANISTDVWFVGTNLLAIRARNTTPQSPDPTWNPSFLDVRILLNSPFEFTNCAPKAVAGPEVYTTVGTPVLISGFVADDGRRNGSPANEATWNLISGPGGYFYTDSNETNLVQFAFTNYLLVNFIAYFSEPGDYLLELTATDRLVPVTDTLTVHVSSSPPTAPTITLTSPTNNALFVTDDDIPVTATVTAGSGTITNVAFYAHTAWGLLSIGNDASSPYSVNWPALTGTYIVQAYVQDDLGYVGMSTSTNVQVVNNRSRPIAMVGPDLSVRITNTALLSGIVVDDGWPNHFGTATWTNLSGPVGGEVHFTYTNVLFTNWVSDYFTNYLDVKVSAQFTEPGEYVLRLIANDGQTTAQDELTVTVDSGTVSPPVVNLTSPTGGQVFGAGVPIVLAANATTTNGTIAKVGVFAAWASNSVLVAQAEDDSLSVDWVPPEGGTYTFTARAFDDSGREGVSTPATVLVEGRTSAHLPFAYHDDIPVLANSIYNVLYPLTNDVDLDGDDLTIISIYDGPHWENKARIINSGKAVSFVPEPGFHGSDSFYYTVSDGHGGTATSYVNVWILGAEMPTVAITNPVQNAEVDAGDLITLKASVTPTNFQGKVEFFRNNIKLGEVSSAPYNLDWRVMQDACGCGIIAVATDTFGQYNTSQPLYLDIGPPTPSMGPVGNIINLSDVQTNSEGHAYSITPIVTNGLFDLTGTAYATNPSVNTVTYAIQVLSVSDGSVIRDVTPFPRNADGFHTNTVALPGGSLATNLDFTTLQNGVYDLRLIVRADYEETVVVVRFGLESNLKLGQFSFSEQDVVIPAGTFPLAVTRTYNSLNPNFGEFGYSWTYAINDVDLQLDEERAEVEYLFRDNNGAFEPSGDTFSLRVGGGRNVTLTLPDGQRTTFYYYLQPSTCNSGDPVKLCADPKWQSAPSVYYDLGLLKPVKLTFLLNSGLEWWSGPAGDASSHPESYEFGGFVLTNRQDGTQYVIEREDLGSYDFLSGTNAGNYAQTYGKAHLTRIIQRNQEKIHILPDGMVYVDAGGVTNRTVKFARDAKDRIIAIYDPNSLDANGDSNAPPVVKYEYAGDNLAYVHRLQNRDNPANPIYLTTIYEYTNAAYPHYITSIVDPRGITIARNQYDETGKLIALWDADGKRTQFIHSTSNKVEIVTDRLGNTNSFVYDLRGNVTFTTNALNVVTALGYDAINHKIAETNALGTAQVTWSLYAYDEKGNQTNSVSSPNHTNSFAFDSATGNLLRHVDPVGNLTTNGYDGFGNLTNTVQLDSNNVVITKSSSIYSNGRLVETRNANDEATSSFDYDSSGNLTSSTDANEVTRYFTYDDNGNQTSSYYFAPPAGGGSPVGVTNYTVYDAQGRAIRSVDPLGNTNYTFYNALGKVDYTVDKLGNSNSFLYDTRGNLIRTTHADGLMTYTVYDDAGRAFLTTDRNGITATRTYFDAAGRATNVVRLTNAVVSIELGPRSVLTNEGTPISTNSTEYFDSGWVKSRTGPDGQPTTYAYWPDGQTMYVTNALDQTTFYAYDIAGRQDHVVDALNRTNRFTYDAVGRMVKAIFHDGTFTTNIFNLLGQRVGVKDQADRLTQFTYDLSGQLTNVSKPQVPDPVGGTNATPVWSYEYDQYGRLTVTTDPKSQATTNRYDEFGREVARTLTLGETNWTKYNSLGQVSEIWDFKKQKKKFVYDRFGRVATNYYFETGATYPSNSIAYLYNQLGQLTNIIERSGTYANIGYLAAIGNPGKRGRFAAMLASVEQLPPGPTGGVLGLNLCGVATMIWLTAEARRRRVPTWQFARIVLATLRLNFSTSTGVASSHARTQIPQWLLRVWPSCIFHLPPSLLSLCSLTAFMLRCGGTPEGTPKRLRLPSYSWRFATMIILVALIGSDPRFDGLWTARAACDIPSNPTLTQDERITTFSYDLEGRLAQVNSPEGVINYAYDLATGRLIRTCSQNTEVAYDYDALGRLWKVHALKLFGTPLTPSQTTTYEYTEVGSRKKITLPSDGTTDYTYDSLNRLTGLTNRASDTSILSLFNYQVDQTGRRTNAVEILKLVDEETTSYQTNTLTWQYDGLYRLTNETCVSTFGGSYTNNYHYDKAGNRWSKVRLAGGTTTTITNFYNANDQLLKEVTLNGSGVPTVTNLYNYDANGSLIAKTNISSGGEAAVLYGYDLKNKLSSATTAGTGHTNYYVYNDQGIRVRTVNGGTTTKYLIDANNHTGYAQVLEELSHNGMYPSFKSYVIGDDVLTQVDSAAIHHLLYDGHGSTRQMVNDADTVNSRHNYDAYGVMLDSYLDAETIAGDVGPNLLYCGEQYDSTLNMYNLRARFYDPNNGRFNARDTFMGNNDDPQSLHKYLYCHSDPLNRIDPSGEVSLVEALLAVTVVAVVATAVFILWPKDKVYKPTRVGLWVPGGYNAGDTTLFQNIARKNSQTSRQMNTAKDLFDLLQNQTKSGHSIQILTIAGHGWGAGRGPGIPGNQDPALGGNDAGIYVDGHPVQGGGRTISDLKKLVDDKKIIFAKDALIQIHACRISSNFIEGLAKATGATVVSASSSCFTEGSDYRWKSAPGVWAERSSYSGFWRSKAGHPVEEIGAIYEQK